MSYTATMSRRITITRQRVHIQFVFLMHLQHYIVAFSLIIFAI